MATTEGLLQLILSRMDNMDGRIDTRIDTIEKDFKDIKEERRSIAGVLGEHIVEIKTLTRTVTQIRDDQERQGRVTESLTAHLLEAESHIRELKRMR
jgi:chromosome segregation ATPase